MECHIQYQKWSSENGCLLGYAVNKKEIIVESIAAVPAIGDHIDFPQETCGEKGVCKVRSRLFAHTIHPDTGQWRIYANIVLEEVENSFELLTEQVVLMREFCLNLVRFFSIKRGLLLFLMIFPFTLFAADKSAVKPSVLSLPSGPGSIEGLGESFEPQLNSGTASYAVPLAVLPGRAGLTPQLALSYNSGNGNNIAGLGWALNLPYLQRQTDKGLPFYTDYPKKNQKDDDQDGTIDEADEWDTFIYSNGEELLPLADGSFRFENESEFSRFTRLDNGGWQVQRSNGLKLVFGAQADSRIADEQGRIFRWLPDSITDTRGNTIHYEHAALDNSRQRYCRSIRYNTHMRIDFDYEARPDILADYRPRFELKTAYRLKTVRMSAQEQSIRSYELTYGVASVIQPLSLLTGISQIGRDGSSRLPPAEFSYTDFHQNAAQPQAMPSAPHLSLNDGDIDLLDINHDGLPDILDSRDTAHDYYLNQGEDESGTVQWAQRQTMNTPTLLKLASDEIQLADMDGNGSADLMLIYGADVQVYELQQQDNRPQWRNGALLRQTSFNFRNNDTRLADLNHDKRIDVMRIDGTDISLWLNDGKQRWSKRFLTARPPNSELHLSNPNIRFADMNGDRLQDLVNIKNDYCAYYPNMGFGQFGAIVRCDNPPGSVADESRLLLADVNGDGLSDVLAVDMTRVRVWLNMGLNPDNHQQLRLASSFDVTAPYTDSTTVFRQADVNANGSVDILWNTGNDFEYVDFAPGEQPCLLKSISNGIGQTVTVSYRSSIVDYVRDRDAGRPWPQGLPFPVAIIGKVTTHDGLHEYSTEYSYHDGYYDGGEKEFRGFAAAEKREVGDESAPDLVSAYQYDTGVQVEALKGKPLNLETRNAQNQVFFRESYEWQTRALGNSEADAAQQVQFVFQSQKQRTLIEKGSDTPVSLQWDYDYDNYGNRIYLLEHGRLDAGWDDERLTVSRFSAEHESGLQNWLLNLPLEVTVSDENEVRAAHSRYFYDKFTTLGQVSKGDLTLAEQWVKEEEYIQTERKDYDQYGNIIALYDPLYGQEPGHYREILYDTVYQAFPEEERIHTGERTLSVSVGYDFGLGKITASKDFNGHQTAYAYDAFGRLESITKPLDTLPAQEYDYVLAHPLSNGQTINWIETRLRESADGGTLDSRSFFDGLGRKIMTRSEGEEAGQIVVSDTVQFNARKQIWRKYLPYFEQATLDYQAPTYQTGYTEHRYDALGRLVHSVQPDSSFAVIEYAPLSRTLKDEEQTNPDSKHYGAAIRYVDDGLTDADGNHRLREVHEITPEEWITRYRYDLLNNLTGYTDAQNNVKTVKYDGLSRKTYMADPDRGDLFYYYDDAGNLNQTIDNKQQVIRYEYDGVNRLLAEYYSANKIQPDVRYHYDLPYGALSKGELLPDADTARLNDVVLGRRMPQAGDDLNQDDKIDVADVVHSARMAAVTAQNTLGMLSWIEDQSGQEHNSYDARGRSAWTLKRIRGQLPGQLRSFHTALEYDSADRPTRRIYPDGSHVEYRYNRRGLLESVPGVIAAYDYNPAGQNASLALANQVTTAYEYDARLRLKNLHSTRTADNRRLQDFVYTYDSVSNITHIDDLRDTATLGLLGAEPGMSQTEALRFNATQQFAYDNLYRLTQAQNLQVYGTLNYQYDRIGNMIHKQAELLTPDPLMNLGSMENGGSASGAFNRGGRKPGDPPGPHAVTATTLGPDGPLQFSYDDNGNMTRERSSVLAWDYKDRLVGLHKGALQAEYRYDYGDSRKKKQVFDQESGSLNEIYYIDSTCEIRDGRLVKYILAGSNRIARADGSGPTGQAVQPDVFYLYDHLGSTHLSLNPQGKVQEQMLSYPFGHPRLQHRATPETRLADYGFTGKEQDLESGLQYFDARYLLASIGGWTSVDPLFSQKESRILKSHAEKNIYMYCINNPLNSIDPDGMEEVHLGTTGILTDWYSGGFLGTDNKMYHVESPYGPPRGDSWYHYLIDGALDVGYVGLELTGIPVVSDDGIHSPYYGLPIDSLSGYSGGVVANANLVHKGKFAGVEQFNAYGYSFLISEESLRKSGVNYVDYYIPTLKSDWPHFFLGILPNSGHIDTDTNTWHIGWKFSYRFGKGLNVHFYDEKPPFHP
ncbi:MAG: hypothetical protein GY862_37055 [Gammaproteobacteria bacterium]|nr:hypothetical protein [Gammaproteobacteria bacterium]